MGDQIKLAKERAAGEGADVSIERGSCAEREASLRGFPRPHLIPLHTHPLPLLPPLTHAPRWCSPPPSRPRLSFPHRPAHVLAHLALAVPRAGSRFLSTARTWAGTRNARVESAHGRASPASYLERQVANWRRSFFVYTTRVSPCELGLLRRGEAMGTGMGMGMRSRMALTGNCECDLRVGGQAREGAHGGGRTWLYLSKEVRKYLHEASPGPTRLTPLRTCLLPPPLTYACCWCHRTVSLFLLPTPCHPSDSIPLYVRTPPFSFVVAF
ncbi:hypothetical protein K438DRAFT_1879938 [Mycena galopus ATCC 62051]|nr:hypothetical protein K438DRAFT_1879938 [Mycena galopus ATCC 62051]